MEKKRNSIDDEMYDDTDNQLFRDEEEAPLSTRDRVRALYPDEEDDVEDDALYGRLYDDYTNLKEDNDEFVQDINDLFAANPDMAVVAEDMIVNRLPFRVALAKHMSPEDLEPKEGDDDYDAFEKSYNERLEQANRRKSRTEELDKNEEESFANIDRYCDKRGYDDATKEALIGYINQVFDAIVEKRISPELLAALDKARTYDKDVARAHDAGEIKGRNANIEVQRIDRMKAEEGDGIPSPRGDLASPLQPAQEDSKDYMKHFWDNIGDSKFSRLSKQ